MDEHMTPWMPDPAKAAALSARLVRADRRYHASKAPGCETWERYTIAAMDPDTRRRTRMWGIGCEEHDVFLSWGQDEPMPSVTEVVEYAG